MPVRLNKKAYKILVAEVIKAADKDEVAGDISRQIALRRLKSLNSTKGKPVTEAELKYLISDLFPNFNHKAIAKAIRVNRPASKLWLIPKLAVGLGGLTGLIWILNLPYPMIRRPVAKTAPIVLLPSYLKMDRNYRQAIANVEQADQLVNQATSLEDLKLGQEKVSQAQKNLDALPVWFLGYEPQPYRSWFNFGWKFTLDEFKAARSKVGRMEAKTFQEINAYTKLEQAKQDIQRAKQNYQQAVDAIAEQQAIFAWQAGIDRLESLPANTTANEQAQPLLTAYRRDFRSISGLVAGNDRTNKILAVAQQFYSKASNRCSGLPRPAHYWQECIKLIDRAIAILEKVPLEDAGYLAAQTLLASYESDLGKMRIRHREQESSQRAYESAQQAIANLPKSIDQYSREHTAREILMIINQLERVQPQTTVYPEARSTIDFANKKLEQLS